MPRKYTNFFEKEMPDGTYVIAEPVDASGERVRLQADWFDGDKDDEAEFERVVSMIILEILEANDASLVDGGGTISRSDAKAAMRENDGDIVVTGEPQAEALIDYFESEGVFDLEGDTISILRDLDDIDELSDSERKKKRILNWAAAFDAGTQKITNALDAFEQSKDKLETYLNDIDTAAGAQQSNRKEEIAREIMQLGDGDGFPEAADLEGHEKRKYKSLKRQYIQAEKREDIGTGQIERVQHTVDEMGNRITELRDAKDFYKALQSEMRLRAFEESQQISGVDDELIKELINMPTVLTGEKTIEEEMDELEDEEFQDKIESEFEGQIQESQEFAENVQDAKEQLDIEETTGSESTELSQ